MTYVEECDFERRRPEAARADRAARRPRSRCSEFPELNARLEGDEIVYLDRYDLGIAVQTEQGLVVPVVRGCDTRSIDELAADVDRLAADGARRDARARGAARLDVHGHERRQARRPRSYTPLVNHPEVAILGVAPDRPAPGRPRRRGGRAPMGNDQRHVRPPRRRRRPRRRVHARRDRPAAGLTPGLHWSARWGRGTAIGVARRPRAPQSASRRRVRSAAGDPRRAADRGGRWRSRGRDRPAGRRLGPGRRRCRRRALRRVRLGAARRRRASPRRHPRRDSPRCRPRRARRRGARVRARRRLPRGGGCARCSARACAAARPTATPGCARSPGTELPKPVVLIVIDGLTPSMFEAADTPAIGSCSSTARYAPRRVDVPVADAGLPLVDRNRRPPRRPPHPAPRLVEPRRAAARRVRLVVRRDPRRRHHALAARHGHRPERAPPEPRRRDDLRGARAHRPRHRGDQHHVLPGDAPAPRVDPRRPRR